MAQDLENIGPDGVRARWMMSVVGFGGALALGGWLYSQQALKLQYNWLFPFLFVGFLGKMQARQRFCVAAARKGPREARVKAYFIVIRALLWSATVTAVTVLAA